MRRLVVLESPYAGNVRGNLEYAKLCLLDCLNRGEAPFAAHLLYRQALDYASRKERALGVEAGFA